MRVDLVYEIDGTEEVEHIVVRRSRRAGRKLISFIPAGETETFIVEELFGNENLKSVVLLDERGYELACFGRFELTRLDELLV